jgi:hypothetical protein
MIKTLQLMFIFFFVANFSFAQNLKENLLLYYPLNGDAKDYSGNGFDGENNAIPIEDRNGEANSAMDFNGVDTYIDLPFVFELKPDFPFSFSFWVNCKGTSDAILTTDFAMNSHSGTWIGRSSSTSNFGINLGNAEPNTSSAQRYSVAVDYSIEDFTWYHVVAIKRSFYDTEFYVNGVRRNLLTPSGTASFMAYTNNPGSLGRKDGNILDDPTYFTGSLDEFYFWNRALNQEDVDSLFYGGGLSNNVDISDQGYSLNVYPNPSYGMVNYQISTGSTVQQVTVYSLEGKIAKVIEEPGYKSLNLTGLSEGYYTLEFVIKSADGHLVRNRKKLAISR